MTDLITQHSARRLSKASVTGVLGEFNHEIKFKNSEDFAIIFGPNGIGKTKFLEIINALSNLNTDQLGQLPFKSASLFYTDGTELSVQRAWIEMDDQTSLSIHPYEQSTLFGATFKEMQRFITSRSSDDQKMAKIEMLSFTLVREGEQSYSAHTPVGMSEELFSLFRDSLELEEFSTAEFRMLMRRRKNRNIHPFPEEFTNFSNSQDVRLIETQRLMAFENNDQKGGSSLKSGDKRPHHKIEEHSQTVRAQLENDLSANSRLTQRLDSSFPRRMLEVADRSTMTDAQIREQLADQNHRRARITEITSSGLGSDIPLSPGKLTTPQIAMLELYLKDAEVKLSSFTSTVEKINLLEEIINDRLLRKKLKITADRGLEIIRDLDNESIPLTSLSSGEQHEIILMFDLLFNVQKEGLVLIDEPEISLHIAWQQKFISDVIRIARLVGFQFIIATHSPQIIDKFWSYAERLGPDSSEFND